MNRILPAYPLWIIDPNFSIWSAHDRLNGRDASFWTGLSRKTYGFVRYDGTTYCFLGLRDGTKELEQISVSISAFGTEYVFGNDEFKLKVEFISPLMPDKTEIMSCPVCYTRYSIETKNKLPEDFSVSLALDEEYCYNEDRAETIGGVLPLDGYEAAFMTRKRNLIMSNSNDRVAPDWGDIYLTGESGWFITESALNQYIQEGKTEYIRKEGERNYIFAVNCASSGFFMTAYDDRVSVFCFGEWLKSLYFDGGKNIIDALNFSYENSAYIWEECNKFDEKLKFDCMKVGDEYYTLACAALRQSVGAHKLVKNGKGELLFLSKECASNGCIGTVDVSYPSMPLFLIYNPELVNAMMTGIYDFARKPVWTYDFAPHDIGTYPWCCGQVYGVNNSDDKYACKMVWPGDLPVYVHTMLYLRPASSNVYDFNIQMPVEECGNMLIMTAAAIRAGASKKQALENFDLLQKWVLYLEKYGLKPENQLCTDDFAGHLANNVNLAIKALVGIEGFSIICNAIGKDKTAEEYVRKAKDFAKKLKELTGDDIMPLAYGIQGSYSLKYNLLFDKLFGFNLIGQNICERETDFYIEKNNRFGVPLDTRADYTKSDWILWTAALTDKKEKTEALYKPVIEYLKYSPDRLPFGDWYGTDKGEVLHFINRTVQGGVFAPLLKVYGVMMNKQ